MGEEEGTGWVRDQAGRSREAFLRRTVGKGIGEN